MWWASGLGLGLRSSRNGTLRSRFIFELSERGILQQNFGTGVKDCYFQVQLFSCRGAS
jgi:hypothetical protein